MIWLTNPRHVVPENCLAMVDLFLRGLDPQAFASGSSGFGAMRFLPDEGGLNDQASTVNDSFLIISQVVRGLRYDMAS